ncbi:hypothetical protein [Croceicoccus sp. Ery5]|uniref:hypothetical protein n=1 Tax=Croceicoccus sp. Ery5 TaxID=1703340 RepID=UPI001E443EB6|nr:hypothetical protein [Croceicoccus sp. Ery5]
MFLNRLACASRILLAGAGAMALTGCLFTPGKFDSQLVLTKGGHFSFSYEGEITTMGLSQMAAMDEPEPFEPACYDEDMELRDCTGEEIQEQQADWEDEQAEDARDKEQFAKMFAGMDPSDPEMAEKLVLSLKKMRGWDEVSHRGNGVYDVKFRTDGMLTHSFLFPVLEDMPGMTQFVSVTPRADGSVRVVAPGFGGDQSGMGQSMSMMMAMGAAKNNGGDDTEIVLPDGQFTIRTDGDILTNNTDEGPVTEGTLKVLHWTVDTTSKVAPTALIRL